MCHNKIAFCDDDHTGLVVPALGILFHQGAQTRSLGRNERIVLDVVGREPPLQRSEVAIGKGLREEFAHDGFVAQRVVRHLCVLLRSNTARRTTQRRRTTRCATKPSCANSSRRPLPIATSLRPPSIKPFSPPEGRDVLLKPSGVAAPTGACGCAC